MSMAMETLQIKKHNIHSQILGKDLGEYALLGSYPIYTISLSGTWEDYIKDIILGGTETTSSDVLKKFYYSGILVANYGRFIPVAPYTVSFSGVGPYAKVTVTFDAVRTSNPPDYDNEIDIVVNSAISNMEFQYILDQQWLLKALRDLDGYLQYWYPQHWTNVSFYTDITHHIPVIRVNLYGVKLIADGYTEYSKFMNFIEQPYIIFNATATSPAQPNAAYIYDANANLIGDNWVHYTMTMFLSFIDAEPYHFTTGNT